MSSASRSVREARVPLTGQIMVSTGTEDSPYEPWGKTFEIEPRFAARAPALAGRHDFFRNFMVIFCGHEAEPFFMIRED